MAPPSPSRRLVRIAVRRSGAPRPGTSATPVRVRTRLLLICVESVSFNRLIRNSATPYSKQYARRTVSMRMSAPAATPENPSRTEQSWGGRSIPVRSGAVNEPRRHHHVPRFYPTVGVARSSECSSSAGRASSSRAIPAASPSSPVSTTSSTPPATCLLTSNDGSVRLNGPHRSCCAADRQSFAHFLALQYTRTPERRERIRFPEMVSGWLAGRDLSRELIAEYLTDVHLGFVPADDEIEGAFTYVPVALHDVELSTNEAAMRMMNLGAQQVSPAIEAMRWTVEDDRRGRFISSDTPLTMWRPPTPATSSKESESTHRPRFDSRWTRGHNWSCTASVGRRASTSRPNVPVSATQMSRAAATNSSSGRSTRASGARVCVAPKAPRHAVRARPRNPRERGRHSRANGRHHAQLGAPQVTPMSVMALGADLSAGR